MSIFIIILFEKFSFSYQRNLHFVVEDKLNGLFKSVGLYIDEKSVDIGPNKVVKGDTGI